MHGKALLPPQLVFNPVVKNLSTAIFDIELHAPPFVIEEILHLLLAALVQHAHFLVPTLLRGNAYLTLRVAYEDLTYDRAEDKSATIPARGNPYTAPPASMSR